MIWSTALMEHLQQTKDASCYDRDDRPTFELKKLSEEGTFEGYASVFGVKDLQDEIVDRGAFKKSLKDKRGEFPLLWAHNHNEPIGRITEAEEDKRGLKVIGKLALGVQRAKDTYELMREKIVRSMSIGYRVIRDEFVRDSGVRHLKEVDLWEISAVLFPANQRARIRAVKSVVPYQNLPVADANRRWQAAAAVKRVRAWAKADDQPNSRYRRAFVWFDAENEDSFSAYKMPIADVVDDELVAVPRAIFAAAAAMMGARGGAKLPETDAERVKQHLERYYKKLDRDPPWGGAASLEEFWEHVVDLWEHTDEAARKDLLDQYKPSRAPLDWSVGAEPSRRIADGLFSHWDEFLPRS